MTSDPVREPTRPTWFLVGAIALTVVLYLWPLTIDAPLVDPDEGLHAAIAQEMLDRGDAVVPRFLGEPFLDKPILYFWALMASLQAFGATESAVRLPGLCFGWLGTLTTALLAWQIAGPRIAHRSSVFFATTILPLALNQVAVHDVALVPWTNLGLLFLWRADRGDRMTHRLGAAVAAGLFVGLAMLTKGLVGVALIGVPFAIALALERRLTAQMVLLGAVTTAVGLAVAAPWYLLMEGRQPGYLHYFFVERHLMGFATTTQIHGERPWFYYLPILAGGAWPWGLIALAGWRRPADVSPVPGRRLIQTWLVVDTLLLSTAGSKLVTYLLPVFPAVAILAAIAWEERVQPAQREGGPRAPRAFGAAVWVNAIVGVAVVPASLVLAHAWLGAPTRSAGWIGSVVLVGGYLVLLSAWRARQIGRVLPIQAGLVVATFVVLMTCAFQPVAEQLSARALGRSLNGRGAMPPQLWVVDERIGSVVFYLDPSLRRDLSPSRVQNVALGLMLGRLPTSPPGALVAVAERDVVRLERGVSLAGVPYDRAGRHRVYTTRALLDHMMKVVGGLAPGVTAQSPPVLTITHHARAVRPGEAVLLVIRAPVRLAAVRASSSLGPVVVHRDDAAGRWLGLLGLDLQTKAGSYEVIIDATTADGAALEARHRIAVRSRRFPTRQLSVDDAFVNPPAGARARIEEETRAVDAVLARVSPEAGWAVSFERPVPGELTSGFGRRSVLNGEVRSVHAGVDMRAPTGTPVCAPADARVALADEHYFAGRLVILDHGLGVFSFLAHLSSIAVVEGQRVRVGEIVGRSGATGRVTGPHLHWSVRVGGARVDPLSLGAAIDAMKKGRELPTPFSTVARDEGPEVR